jgi:hypothetical protein
MRRVVIVLLIAAVTVAMVLYALYRKRETTVPTNAATLVQFGEIVDGQTERDVRRQLGEATGSVRRALISRTFWIRAAHNSIQAWLYITIARRISRLSSI